MGKSRPRYNEKARASSLKGPNVRLHPNARDGGIKALKKKYEQSNDITEQKNDENVSNEQNPSKISQIKTILDIPTDVKISSTKKKRLEKYIEKKLKKEEHADLMQKLSESSLKSNDLLIKSASGISAGVQVTEKERVTMAYKAMKAGLNVEQEAIFVKPKEVSVEIKPVASVVRPQLGSALKRKTDQVINSQVCKKQKPQVLIMNEESSSESENEESEQDVQNSQNLIVQDCESKQITTNLEVCPQVQKIVESQQQQKKDQVNSKPAKYVLVERKENIEIERQKLPIVCEESQIMEFVLGNSDGADNFTQDVLVLCGETGSGKTTQVPQFLFEHGFGNGDLNNERGGMIGVTQPRRVAAISIAKRVSEELNDSKLVSHQVRYDMNVTEKTAIKYMTDGILLKETSQDLLLLKYSCIIIDEAHERSLNTDILIGLLSRVVPLRRKMFETGQSANINGKSFKVYPLKLVIMSATLRVDDFVQNQLLFKTPPPLFEVKGRQYPVTVHFSKRTPDNYVTAAFDKVCKIHQKLPKGGILVFLTGQAEILSLVQKLKKRFRTIKSMTYIEGGDQEENCDDFNEAECDLSDDDNITDGFLPEEINQSAQLKLHVLPLYALQSTQNQVKVFEQIPEDSRLCVVATNIAETSLTIPGIKYVVDCGRVKELQFDAKTGVSSYQNVWTSKSSADQRSGRAGRCEPGHTYRLYSSAVYQHQMQQYTLPEIQRMPIDGVVLTMKCMSIDNVLNFPFPSPPDKSLLVSSEKLLVLLGALDQKSKKITKLGQLIYEYPVHPRLGKLIVQSSKFPQLVSQALALVAALTVGDMFEFPTPTDNEPDQNSDSEQKDDSAVQSTHKSLRMFDNFSYSDCLLSINVISHYNQARDKNQFCSQYHIREKAMVEITKLFNQLTNICKQSDSNEIDLQSLNIDKLNQQTCETFKKLLMSSYVDQIAVKCKRTPGLSQTPYKPLFQTLDQYNADSGKIESEYVFIHPQSILFNQNPDFVIYQRLQRASGNTFQNTHSQKRVYMVGLTALSSLNSLPFLCPQICHFGKPIENPSPYYDQKNDQIMIHVPVTVGSAVSLNLNPAPLPLNAVTTISNGEKLRIIARFILDGSIFPKLKKFQDLLDAKPSMVVNQKLGINHSKISSWIQALNRYKVLDKSSSGLKQALNNIFGENQNFLIDAFCKWLPEDYHKEVKKIWPPLD